MVGSMDLHPVSIMDLSLQELSWLRAQSGSCMDNLPATLFVELLDSIVLCQTCFPVEDLYSWPCKCRAGP